MGVFSPLPSAFSAKNRSRQNEHSSLHLCIDEDTNTMVKEQQHQRRRAPVIRGRKRSGRARTAARSSTRAAAATVQRRTRGTNLAASSRSAAAAASNHSSASTTAQQVQLRNMRAEKRRLLQQLAESERRAKVAEEDRDKLLMLLPEEDKPADEEINDLKKRGPVLRDRGTELWQNVWCQDDVSIALTFPTSKSVVCESVDEVGGNDMPGVYSSGAISNGRTTQSIWMKGKGYTLVGLVTCDEEKAALRHRAGKDFRQMPMMTNVYSAHWDAREGDVFTIEVDMIERRAELFISDKDASHQLTPHITWEGLPEKVWVAVAFKRNSEREAVLMPCIHHNVTEE